MEDAKIIHLREHQPKSRQSEAPKRLRQFASPQEYNTYVEKQLSQLRANKDMQTVDRYLRELAAESIVNLFNWSQNKEVAPARAEALIRGHLAYLLGNTSDDKALVNGL